VTAAAGQAAAEPETRPPPRPPRGGRKLLGCTEPRLWTPPLRPLSRRTSRGYEVADFAEITGEPLLPWERWTAIHALELLPDRSYRFRVIIILAARQNAKSHLKRTISLWRMYMNPRSRILGIAQDLDLAKEQWSLAQETIQDTPDLAAELGRVVNVNGQEAFWLTNGSRYKIKASNRKAGRGSSNDEVNIDELREQRSWDAWSAVSKTTMARANSQIWCMSNAGDEESVVLNQLADAAHSGRDPSIGIFEYSAPDGCDLDDRQAWRQANPGLGYIISEGAIQSAMATDPPEIFRTEVLCQRVSNLDTAVDIGAWRDCADPSGTLTSQRGHLAACADVALDSAHVTLAVAAKLPDGRVRVEIAAAWNGTEPARAELDTLLDRISPEQSGWFPSGPAAVLAPILRKRKGSRELKGGEVTEACQGLADLAQARQLVHNADPLLDAHIGGAHKLTSGDGWRFTRKGSGHCDAAYAAAGAVLIALTMPEPQRPRIRILS
jgi:Phage Terminase